MGCTDPEKREKYIISITLNGITLFLVFNIAFLCQPYIILIRTARFGCRDSEKKGKIHILR